ncbi:MAG: glycosyltransferase family 2 protein [Propionibacteriaceae bacterium]|nr:glycosyltransferase family 2 protein [Propionibacteriaceae bacterium]
MKTLVITPAWNEAEAIAATLGEIISANPGVDVLVVDDGSTDATADIAEAAGAIVLRLPFNLGVGGAMRAGYEFARRYDYDQAIQVDADGQHAASDIPLVLSGLADADICLGARFAGKGEYSVHGPRRWAMSLLAAIVSRMAGTKLTDITSGFRAANRKAIAQYCRHYPAEYLGDTVDSLVMAIRSGCSVTQVPVEMLARRAGQASHNPFKSTILLGRTMFALLVALTRRRVSEKDGA